MLKKYNTNGQKAYQRTDFEDRSLVYKDWLRTIEVNGFFMDIDMLKWKKVNGQDKIVAITELTRCDRDEVGEKYLMAILDRWFVRDRQAYLVKILASKLEVPAYIVCFNKDMKWVWVFSFRREEWKLFTPEQWAVHLNDL